jgi:capsular polysaccharide biosynthesis protein
MSRPAGIPDDFADRLWAFDDLSVIRGGPAIDVTAGLVSLGFLKSALRRGRKVWLALTVIGFVIGCGLYVEFPPAFHATTTVVLVDSPNQDPAQEVQTDVALAGSTTVAANVIKQLGLNESVAGFGASYSVAPITEQIIIINASAPTSGAALTQAAAIAKQFLAYRAIYTQDQFQAEVGQLQGQVTQAQQNLTTATAKLASNTDPTMKASLQDQQKAATDALAQIRQYVTGNVATLQTAEANMVQGSQVLDSPQLLKASKLKGGPLYIVGGLFGGLALGMAIVMIAAMTSDRLRRRSDIAYTFGAPVRLSVGPLRAGRLPELGKAAAKQRERGLRQVVDYLFDAIPGSSRGPAGLAIAAVDDVKTAAEIVVALAVSSADRGAKVIVADLSDGRHLARALGEDKPGVNPVTASGKQLMLVVPEPDDVAPVGPMRSRNIPVGIPQPNERLLGASNSADLIFTLVTPDPSIGSERLTTWATDVVALVTTGESTAARIKTTAELIRIAGAHLHSVVLIGADSSDESLGVFAPTEFPARI